MGPANRKKLRRYSYMGPANRKKPRNEEDVITYISRGKNLQSREQNPKSKKGISRRNLETTMVPMRAYATEEGRKVINGWRLNYLAEVAKSEGFDISGLPVPPDFCERLMETICDEEGCSPLAFLYAKMGLHRYNMLEGKNLGLSSVKKYNQSTGSAASAYYITLEAMDPDMGDSSLQTFQTRVREHSYGEFIISCGVARPLGETKKSDIGEIKNRKPLEKPFLVVKLMPEWPSENPFEDPKLMNESELQANHDVIRLYLELAVATTNRYKDPDLSNLEILQVAIDTTSKDYLDEAIYPKFVATFYIRYKDSCEARVGKDVDRVAVVRRFFNQRMGCLSLVGQNLSSQVIIPKIDNNTSSQMKTEETQGDVVSISNKRRKVDQPNTKSKPNSKPIWIIRSSAATAISPLHEASAQADKTRAKVVTPETCTTIKLANQFSALDDDCTA